MSNIKEKVIEYRNTHKEVRVLLGVVLGEFERTEMDTKRKISGPVTDDEAINIIKKLIDGNNQCNITGENEILELFVPKQLTEDEIESIIKRERFISIKDCMSFFKELYTGLYDGKLISRIYKLND